MHHWGRSSPKHVRDTWHQTFFLNIENPSVLGTTNVVKNEADSGVI